MLKIKFMKTAEIMRIVTTSVIVVYCLMLIYLGYLVHEVTFTMMIDRFFYVNSVYVCAIEQYFVVFKCI